MAVHSSPRLAVALAASGLALAVGGTVVAADAAPAAPAASQAGVKVTIKLAKDHGSLSGKVSSSKAVCKKGRKVRLHFKSTVKGAHYRGVANATSSATGAWKIPAPGTKIPPGSYYVTVGGNKDCKPAQSGKQTVRNGGGAR